MCEQHKGEDGKWRRSVDYHHLNPDVCLAYQLFTLWILNHEVIEKENKRRTDMPLNNEASGFLSWFLTAQKIFPTMLSNTYLEITTVPSSVIQELSTLQWCKVA